MVRLIGETVHQLVLQILQRNATAPVAFPAEFGWAARRLVEQLAGSRPSWSTATRRTIRLLPNGAVLRSEKTNSSHTMRSMPVFSRWHALGV